MALWYMYTAVLALSWACGLVAVAGGDKLHLLRAPQHGFPASFGAQVCRESFSSTLPEDLTWKIWSGSSHGIRGPLVPGIISVRVMS